MRETVATALSALALAPALAFSEQQEERTTSALSENDFLHSVEIGLNVITAYHVPNFLTKRYMALLEWRSECLEPI